MDRLALRLLLRDITPAALQQLEELVQISARVNTI